MFNGRRQPSCGGTSRMTRECHVRFCERLGVQFPGPTRQTNLVVRCLPYMERWFLRMAIVGIGLCVLLLAFASV